LTNIAWAWDTAAVPEAVRSWYAEGDPVLIFARELVKDGGIGRDEIERLDEQVRKEADAAARFALGAVLVFQLALLYRHERKLEINRGLKPFLRAA